MRQLEGHTQPVVSVAFIGAMRVASGSCLVRPVIPRLQF